MPDRPSIPARPSPRVAPLDRAALVRWLESEAVVDGEGRVCSWHNPEHPGYAYPEAGGLWLSTLAREAATMLVEPSGGVRYHEDSRDLNTWATLFTVQALDFAASGADVRRLV